MAESFPDARRVAPISACVWCLRLVLESVRMFMFYQTTITTNRNPQNDLIFDANFELPTLYW